MANPYRYVPPVGKNGATGVVADVYGQLASDFLLGDGPYMSLSPAPDVLAAAWALMRESELVGTVPRVEKELVAVAVAGINGCTYCRDAHTALAHATGRHDLAEAVHRGDVPADPHVAAIVAWARATRTPDAAILADPPFPGELAPEYIGTALISHFINHMADVLVHSQLLPGRLGTSALVRRLAGRAFARTARQDLPAGRSIALLGDISDLRAPRWAGDTPIGPAYAALRAVGNRGGELLGHQARYVVAAAVDRWDGAVPDDGELAEVLDTVSSHDRAAARLALLAALDPHRITDDHVAAWRSIHGKDADLARLLAFGAMAAVERIASWTAVQPGKEALAMTGD